MKSFVSPVPHHLVVSLVAAAVLAGCSSGGGGSGDGGDASGVLPVGSADSYSVALGEELNVGSARGVLANDTGDAGTMSAVLVGSPSRAAAFSLNADGSFSYTPTGSTVGTDKFTYRVVDENGESNSVLVTISIQEEVDLAQISGGCQAYSAGQAATGTLTASGVDSPGFEIISGPTLGTLSGFDGGSGSYTYQRESDQRGLDSFTYRVLDGLGNPIATATQELIAVPYRVMPVGDSITSGVEYHDPDLGRDTPFYPDRVGYRKMLKESLESQGYSIDFVGSATEAGINQFDDVENNGIPGANVSGIDSLMSDWLVATPPEIILMHVGTNATPSDTTVLSSIFDKIANWQATYDREAGVLLARIIARTDYQNKAERVPVFNALIDDFIPVRQAEGQLLYSVDMYNALGGQSGPYLSDDKLHPTAAGYQVMSETWEEELIANGLLHKCD